MIIALLALVVSLPIFAAVLVSFASRREEAQWSLSRPAQGPGRAAARRLLSFESTIEDWPQSRARAMARTAEQLEQPEQMQPEQMRPESGMSAQADTSVPQLTPT
jgi:hypothetical protein